MSNLSANFFAFKSGIHCHLLAVLDPEGLAMNYLQTEKSDKTSKDFLQYL